MNDDLSFLLKEWTKHIKCAVTCSFMMNCDVIILAHVCNWFAHLQPDWQTTYHIDNPIFAVHTCVQQETRQAIMWQMTYH